MKNAKCWTTVAIILFILGALLLAAGLVVQLSVFPNVVKKGIDKGKVLGLNSDGSFNSFTNSWANPQYISTMQYWTMDYKNPIGMLNRALYPDVLEKGPYSYTEKMLSDNINFSDDGKRMNFTQKTTYFFNAAKSCPTCNPYVDTVTVPDISFILAMNAIEQAVEKFLATPLLGTICKKLHKEELCGNIATIIERELGTAMDLFGIGPFVTVTVDQLIFSGYNTPVVDKLVNRVIKILNEMIGTDLIPQQPPVPVNLNSGNGTADFQYTVLTGKTDPQLSGFIQSFISTTNATGMSSNGDMLPPNWWPKANTGNCTGDNGIHALKIFGTNADFFKSHIQKTDKLPLYIDDVCRSSLLVYDRDVTVQGIKAYRFVLPASEFDWTEPSNCGFCVPLAYGAYNLPKNSTCMPSGLLDISGCSAGAPIMISKAHFYQAHPLVQSFVPRFKPNYDDDETTLDIEPNTGTVLNANKRLQINVFMNQMPHIAAYSVLRPGAYPLVRLNESFVMDQGTKDQLNSQLFVPQKVITIICWTSVGVGGFLMALSVIILLITFCVKRETDKKEN
ncbi:unnamed protein product [Auanema sp. JU1783]|nr:unnamed protein product [Auanema sp. JU1783]